jgi:hypothetical protein
MHVTEPGAIDIRQHPSPAAPISAATTRVTPPPITSIGIVTQPQRLCFCLGLVSPGLVPSRGESSIGAIAHPTTNLRGIPVGIQKVKEAVRFSFVNSCSPAWGKSRKWWCWKEREGDLILCGCAWKCNVEAFHSTTTEVTKVAGVQTFQTPVDAIIARPTSIYVW